MRRLALIALILAGTAAAAADGPADNPAFCFGYLAAQPGTDADALRRRKAEIRSLFAKIGPRDSTDERRFEDWERIGRDRAADSGDTRRGALRDGCTRLLGGGRN